MEKSDTVINGDRYLRQTSRLILLQTGLVFAVLLILLGQSEFLPYESEWATAAAMRRMGMDISGKDVPWNPEQFRTLFFVPLINLFYSLIPVAEWAVRLPAVLGTLLFFSGTMALAIAVSGRKNAIASGWLLVSSYGLLYWGRSGCDAIFSAAATVWALWTFYAVDNGKTISCNRMMFFFWLYLMDILLCGITSGIIIFLLLLPRWGTMIYRRRPGWRDTGILLCAFGAAVITVAITIFITIFAGRENVPDRMEILTESGNTWNWFITGLRNEFAGREARNFSNLLLNLPRLLLPWTVFAPAAVCGLYQHRRKIPKSWKILLAGLGVAFTATLFLPCSRWQSQLPLLGPAAIMLAAGLSSSFQSEKILHRSEVIFRYLLVIAAALMLALPLTLPLWGALLNTVPPVLLMTIVPLSGLMILLIFIFGTGRNSPLEVLVRRNSPLAGTIIAGTIFGITTQCVLLPEINIFRTSREFWLNSSSELAKSPQTLIIFYKFDSLENGLAYLAPQQKFIRINSPEELRRTLLRHNGSIAIFSGYNSAATRELQTVVRGCDRTFPDKPLAVKARQKVFTRSDVQKANNTGALWLLKL